MAYIMFYNIGLKVKSQVFKCQIMKLMIEFLEPILENHKPMTVILKHRLQVQTQVCNLQTHVCRLILHLACHTPPALTNEIFKKKQTRGPLVL